jgi:hypothetical protein
MDDLNIILHDYGQTSEVYAGIPFPADGYLTPYYKKIKLTFQTCLKPLFDISIFILSLVSVRKLWKALWKFRNGNTFMFAMASITIIIFELLSL